MLRTGSGNNEALGGPGDDLLVGGSFEDTLFGEQGNDRLRGGRAFDTLLPGPGHDVVDGGKSGGRLDYSRDATSGVHVDLGAGIARAQGVDRLKRVEAIIGTRFDDHLTADTCDHGEVLISC